ncbi:uncharacterized protein DS421_7g219320 [Arachis hypogaea]|nr:uncharacterized protein DS421_7g219320 [Arachis hypogaea]
MNVYTHHLGAYARMRKIPTPPSVASPKTLCTSISLFSFPMLIPLLFFRFNFFPPPPLPPPSTSTAAPYHRKPPSRRPFTPSLLPLFLTLLSCPFPSPTPSLRHSVLTGVPTHHYPLSEP